MKDKDVLSCNGRYTPPRIIEGGLSTHFSLEDGGNMCLSNAVKVLLHMAKLTQTKTKVNTLNFLELPDATSSLLFYTILFILRLHM